MINDYYLSSQEDIYLYFQSITELKAKKVLDVGMTLKRFGALDRNIANLRLPEGIHMTGVDLTPEWKTEIYDRIYDEVITFSDYVDMPVTKKNMKLYQVAMMLRLKPLMEQEQYLQLLNKVCKMSAAVLVSDDGTETDFYSSYGKLNPLVVGSSRYIMIGTY